MKRRSFLQMAGGAVAALFVPAVKAAEKYPFTEYSQSIILSPPPRGFRRVIYSGDVVVYDDGAYRLAQHGDDLNDHALRVAVAVPDGNGGFHYMREGTFAVQVAS